MALKAFRLFLMLALFGSAAQALAAACQSNGTGAWSVAGTWVNCGGATPGVGDLDTVEIRAGHTVTLDVGGRTVLSITIRNTGVLQLGNNATARTLTVSNAGSTGFITIDVGGTLRTNAASDITHTLTFNGNLTNNGTFNLRIDANSLANVVVNGGTQTLGGGGATAQVQNFTVNAGTTANLTSNWNVGGTTAVNGTLGITNVAGAKTFTGNVTIAATGTWNATVNEDVAMGGNLTNNGTFTSGAGTYTFQTTAGATWAGTAGLTFGGNVVVTANRSNATTTQIVGNLSGAAALTNNANQILRIRGNANTLTTLTATAAGNTVEYNGLAAQTPKIANYHHLIVSSAGAVPFIGSFSIAGNLTDNGNFSHTGAGNIVTFNGAAAQSLLGTATNTIFENVTMSNTAAAANRSLTLGHDMTVVAALTFNAAVGTGGRIITGANKVVIQAAGAAAIANACPADANDFIAGNLQRFINAAGVVAFPVGTNGAAAPALACSQVTLTFAAVTTAGSLIVFATQAEHPQIGGSGLDSANSVNRYWTLTTAGILTPVAFTTYDAVFSFVATDIDAGANTAAFFVSRYDGTAWNPTNEGAAAATSTGIVTEAALGDFAIAEPGGFNINLGSVGRFDAYDQPPTTPAGSVRGNIRTKVAGTAFTLTIAHLNAAGTALAALAANVTIDLLDASPAGGVFTNNCSSLWTTVIATSGSVAFGGGTTMNRAFTVNNSYSNVRVRVTRAGGAEIGCSGDAFAIRPADLLVEGMDATWLTAGTTRFLHNTAAPGGNVHAASTAAAATPRPFTIRMTARNSAAATTTNYAGTPTVLSGPTCVLPAGCVPGTLDIGGFTTVLGVVTAPSNYSEAGTFNLQMQDVTFANVDAADTTLAQRRIAQAAPSPREIGRFVPEHFFVAAGSTLTNRSAAACGPASTFSYLGEGMAFAFTLQARNAAAAITQNYTGALAQLNPGTIAQLGFGALDGTTNLTARLDTSVGSAGSFTNGQAAVTATVAVGRAVPDNPDGPFAAARIGIAPTDADGVTARTADMNMDLDGVGGNDHVQVGANTILRFGRLRMDNTVGSEALALPIPIRTEYWTGSAFATNTLDSCTTLARSDIALDFNPPSNLTACETAVSAATVPFSSGLGTLSLTAPGAANNGSVLLTVNLGSAGGSYCNPGAFVAATNSGRAYLLGRWDDAANPDASATTMYDDKPSARAAFGLFGSQPSNFIYFRENF